MSTATSSSATPPPIPDRDVIDAIARGINEMAGGWEESEPFHVEEAAIILSRLRRAGFDVVAVPTVQITWAA